MLIIYLVFFALLDFLIFCFLAKKVKLNFKLRVSLIITLLFIAVFHFSGIAMKSIANNHFYHLILFSLVVLIFHFGVKFLIWIMTRLNHSDKIVFLIKGFNYFRYYLVYILVFVYQTSSLLSNEAREHFNSIKSVL